MSRSTFLARILGVSMVGALLAGCLALPKADTAVFQEPPLENKGTLPAQGGPDDAHGCQAGRGAPGVWRHRGISEPGLALAPDGPERSAALRVDRTRFARRQRHPAGRDPRVPVEAALRLGAIHPRARVSRRLRRSRGAFERPGRASPSTSWTRRPISGSPRTRRPHPGTHSYWVYRYQDFTAGGDRETDSAFRRVVGDLQAAILADGDRIVAAVKR